MLCTSRRIYLLGLMLLLVTTAGLLTSCPGGAAVGIGGVLIDIDARSSRCDDGVKVVVEGIQEEWEFGEPLFGSNTRDHGPNWVWVEPGKVSLMQWNVPVSSPSTTQPEGKRITVKAYCMRSSGEPGLSQRDLALSDFVDLVGWPVAYNILEIAQEVGDSGADPDYTVTPPGLVISKLSD